MSSSSKAQQKFMGIVHSVQKGDTKPSDVSQSVRDASKSMSKKDAKDYASTPLKGLPNKVRQEIVKKLKEYSNKMGLDHLGGDSIPSNKKRGGLRDDDGYDNVQYNRDMPQDESVNEQGVGTATVFLKNQEELDESFPNMKQWWKEDKKEIMTFIYFLQKQLPPSSKDKYDKAWKSILTQLQKRTPAPKSIYQKLINEGGLPQNWMAGRTSDYHTKLRGKKRKYDDTNFAKMNTGQPDIEDEELDPDNEVVNEKFDKVEHLSLLTKALKSMPGSQSQKEIIRQLNVVRKAGGMRPLKETAIEEYASRLTNAYILDDESVLDGTPEPKDAINKESAKKKTKKNYKDWKSTNEESKRDYKDEYKKFQSSTKSKKYRAELNKYNRDKGTYGNGDGKDASHKGGKIVGFESASKNRGRKEKSRLKKESLEVNEIGQFPIHNYIQGIIPTGYLNTNTPEKKKQSVKLIGNLKKTLNTFWKQNNIPFKIK